MPATRWLPLLGAVLAVPACGVFIIDHDARAMEFCERNAAVLERSSIDEEGQQYTEDQARFFSEEVSKTMRYAEDGTRDVRRTARDLADAYDDVSDIAGDDDVPDAEQRKKYTELRVQRAEMRALCEAVVSEGSVER